jgi:hypothetical protein
MEKEKEMKQRMRGFYAILLALALSASHGANAEPIKFNYNEIPFGKPMGTVFGMVKGAEVVQKDSADIGFLRYYQGFLERHFNKGFYTASGQGAELLPQITRAYRVSYTGWDSIFWIDLYFTKGYMAKDDDYRLFMVIKAERNLNTTASYKEVFDSYAKSITQILKTGPQTATYQYRMPSQEKPDPAIVGTWTPSSTKIYLLVHREGAAAGTPLIVYRNNRGWQQYLYSCDKAEQDRKTEIEKKIKRNF